MVLKIARLRASAAHAKGVTPEMDQHVTILGVLHIAWSALGILIAMVIFAAITGGGMLSGDIEVMTITTTIGFIIASFLLIVNLPGLIGGVAILKHYQWGRILTLVVGFLHILNVPFGTFLGIYTLWVLLNDDTRRIFNSERIGG